MTNNKILEFELIDKIKSWTKSNKAIIPIGDDAEGFNLKTNQTTLFAADSLVENIHFIYNKIKPEDLGYKSLAVNISDIAAMGGTPLYTTICLGLPQKITTNYLEKFYSGINEAATLFNINVVGGDISSSNELFISISIIGQVKIDRILKRSNANINDEILVTGCIGGSSAGLKMSLNPNINKISTKDNSFLLNKHFRPAPKVDEARLAAKLGAKTSIDISDGLVSDCSHLCKESGLGCTIYSDKIPFDVQTLNFCTINDLNPLDLALSGGEDYELIFSAPPEIADKLLGEFEKNNYKLTKIGKMSKDRKIKVIDKKGVEVKWSKGFEHFA